MYFAISQGKNEPLPQVEVRKVINLEEMMNNLGKRIGEKFDHELRIFLGIKE